MPLKYEAVDRAVNGVYGELEVLHADILRAMRETKRRIFWSIAACGGAAALGGLALSRPYEASIFFTTFGVVRAVEGSRWLSALTCLDVDLVLTFARLESFRLKVDDRRGDRPSWEPFSCEPGSFPLDQHRFDQFSTRARKILEGAPGWLPFLPARLKPDSVRVPPSR